MHLLRPGGLPATGSAGQRGDGGTALDGTCLVRHRRGHGGGRRGGRGRLGRGGGPRDGRCLRCLGRRGGLRGGGCLRPLGRRGCLCGGGAGRGGLSGAEAGVRGRADRALRPEAGRAAVGAGRGRRGGRDRAEGHRAVVGAVGCRRAGNRAAEDEGAGVVGVVLRRRDRRGAVGTAGGTAVGGDGGFGRHPGVGTPGLTGLSGLTRLPRRTRLAPLRSLGGLHGMPALPAPPTPAVRLFPVRRVLVEEVRTRFLHGRGRRSGAGGRGERFAVLRRRAARAGHPGGAVPVPDVAGDGRVRVVALAGPVVTWGRGWGAHVRRPVSARGWDGGLHIYQTRASPTASPAGPTPFRATP